MAFRLTEHIQALDYDFGTGLSGTIPEPSSKAVNRFFARLSKSINAAGIEVDTNDPVAVAQAMGKLTNDQLDAIVDENLDVICELTQGNPTKAQLDAVGHRARQAFTGWLVGELQNPEGPKPSTKP